MRIGTLAVQVAGQSCVIGNPTSECSVRTLDLHHGDRYGSRALRQSQIVLDSNEPVPEPAVAQRDEGGIAPGHTFLRQRNLE